MKDSLDLFDGQVAAYRDDSPTSRAAAKSIGKELSSLHRRVLCAFGRHGSLTPDACADALGLHWIKVRPRCSQLQEPEWGALLEKAGEVGVSAMGNDMAILRLTAAGRRVVEALHRAEQSARSPDAGQTKNMAEVA